jgi:predicted molibdopterin-dependent oxidoreductase YjgC
MTNHSTDIANANLVLVMGGNAVEAHPCGFKWVTEAKAHNKARLIVVDPRFTRTASVADYYAPIRTGILQHQVRPAIEAFLKERGLELSDEKTHITHISQGFDFLGQNVRKYAGKLLITPARKSVKALLDKVREITSGNKAATQAN